MYDAGDLAAAVRQAAAGLTAAAAAVGRVLESVADALEPDAQPPAAPPPAAKRPKAPTKTRSAPGKRAGRTGRGRSASS